MTRQEKQNLKYANNVAHAIVEKIRNEFEFNKKIKYVPDILPLVVGSLAFQATLFLTEYHKIGLENSEEKIQIILQLFATDINQAIEEGYYLALNKMNKLIKDIQEEKKYIEERNCEKTNLALEEKLND
jgi:predicted ABC-class ATPase